MFELEVLLFVSGTDLAFVRCSELQLEKLFDLTNIPPEIQTRKQAEVFSSLIFSTAYQFTTGYVALSDSDTYE